MVLFAGVISLCGCGNSGEDTENAKKDSTANVVADEKDVVIVDTTKSVATVQYLTTTDFKKKVFDYDVSKDWKFEGELPCIVDFYTDWCKPCKQVAPIMDELAKEYEGKVNFYKVNTDKEKEVSAVMGIRSIPAILFCPQDNGQPQMAEGAMPKEAYVQYINEILFGKTASK
ncbi:MAG: thioredoxin fold domain-containing protein [Bacteroidetes bacterium]|nr:thioredoxin fold domain-containing protein [Bacteroidota bacterium]MBU1721091.1 thioredoxin fold domain-containing protein [Bacteroidota bacterium]